MLAFTSQLSELEAAPEAETQLDILQKSEAALHPDLGSKAQLQHDAMQPVQHWQTFHGISRGTRATSPEKA